VGFAARESWGKRHPFLLFLGESEPLANAEFSTALGIDLRWTDGWNFLPGDPNQFHASSGNFMAQSPKD
jgi:hypothetical protein